MYINVVRQQDFFYTNFIEFQIHIYVYMCVYIFCIKNSLWLHIQRTRFYFPLKSKRIWWYWQHSFLLWTKQNSFRFKIYRKLIVRSDSFGLVRKRKASSLGVCFDTSGEFVMFRYSNVFVSLKNFPDKWIARVFCQWWYIIHTYIYYVFINITEWSQESFICIGEV